MIAVLICQTNLEMVSHRILQTRANLMKNMIPTVMTPAGLLAANSNTSLSFRNTSLYCYRVITCYVLAANKASQRTVSSRFFRHRYSGAMEKLFTTTRLVR